jgi:[protein-PII] uridylyltransferase
MSTTEPYWRGVLNDEDLDAVDQRVSQILRLVDPQRVPVTRLSTAPPGYLLALSTSDIVRHCALLSPVPAANEVRVVATPGSTAGSWHLDVAGRDRPGLLASFSGVLAEAGIDVVQAVVATWDDGAALEAFVVRSPRPPDADGLQGALAASLRLPLWAPAVDDAGVMFDNDASPLYTRCDVQAADRPGLLHAVAVAIARAGADIHAASVTTVDGVACDRFDLSARDGGKVDTLGQHDIVRSLHAGVPGLAPSA